MINWIKRYYNKYFKQKEVPRDPEPIMVRTDLLDHKVDEVMREKIRKDFVEDDTPISNSLDQTFNSLAMSGLSDEAKLKIIKIVNIDNRQRNEMVYKMMNFHEGPSDDMNNLVDETNKNLDINDDAK